MTKPKDKFPSEIFVSIENEGQGEDEYKLINETAEDAAEVNNPKEVGHYILQDVVTVEAEIKVTVK